MTLRTKLEKIIWKHYDTVRQNALNVEALLDEIMPLLEGKEAKCCDAGCHGEDCPVHGNQKEEKVINKYNETDKNIKKWAEIVAHPLEEGWEKIINNPPLEPEWERALKLILKEDVADKFKIFNIETLFSQTLAQERAKVVKEIKGIADKIFAELAHPSWEDAAFTFKEKLDLALTDLQVKE